MKPSLWRKISNRAYHAWLQFQYDQRGQDLVEYALLAASASTVISALFPHVISSSLSLIFTEVKFYLKLAAGNRKSGSDLFD